MEVQEQTKFMLKYPWTKEEDDLLIEYTKQGLTDYEVHKKLPHRSIGSINGRKCILRKKGLEVPKLPANSYNIIKQYKYKSMRINVLGSSSAGNGYVIRTETGESLVIEAGLPFVEVLRSVDYKRDKIVACLVSHSHSDHAKFIEEYRREGLKVIHGEEVSQLSWIELGSGFKVLPFSVEHDVPNCGYIIKHPEIGTLFFATDCSNIPHIFRGIDHWLIEANYSEQLLLLSDTNSHQKKRIMESHQSIEDCKEYLAKCGAENHAKTITLIHLSSRHANPQKFKESVEKKFGVPTFIAKRKSSIYL